MNPKNIRLVDIALASAAALLIVACGSKDKDETPAAEPPPAELPTAEPEAPAAEPPVEEDHIVVLATHSEPKPDDPVEIAFSKFQVVEANFDPDDLTGATAEIEVQMADLASGSAKRDNHLRSDDYLDVAKFPTASVKVAGVEKSGDTTYDATATLTIHGVTAEWPITFEVIERTDDSIRIRSEKTFERTDFSVGAATGEEDSVAPEMTVRVLLTLRPTS